MNEELIKNRKRIGRSIEKIREQKGITQIQLAEKSGLKQSNISRIESGIYATTIDVLYKISEALDSQIELISNDNRLET